jgi:hypothetical protein
MRKYAGLSAIFSSASAFALASAVRVIRLYQTLISPLKPAVCRFHPSCSNYARAALARHGVLRGSALALRRLLRCHPFNAGGYDPVP